MSVFKAVASMKQAGVPRCNTVNCGGHCIKRGEEGDVCGNFLALGKGSLRESGSGSGSDNESQPSVVITGVKLAPQGPFRTTRSATRGRGVVARGSAASLERRFPGVSFARRGGTAARA
jgi:hypothetical protein